MKKVLTPDYEKVRKAKWYQENKDRITIKDKNKRHLTKYQSKISKLKKLIKNVNVSKLDYDSAYEVMKGIFKIINN